MGNQPLQGFRRLGPCLKRPHLVFPPTQPVARAVLSGVSQGSLLVLSFGVVLTSTGFKIDCLNFCSLIGVSLRA